MTLHLLYDIIINMNDALVYHYTKISTFFNIINNKSFWLTDLSSAEDSTELPFNVIKPISKEILGIEDTCFLPAHHYYALSCTNYSDDNLHFVGYGDNHKGVAIGINRNFIRDALPTDTCENIVGYHLKFLDVLYDLDDVKSKIRKLMKANYRGNSCSANSVLAQAYNIYVSSIKSYNYHSENEVRLTYRQDYGGRKTVEIPLLDGTSFRLDDFLLSIGLERTIQNGVVNKVKTAKINDRYRKYYELSLLPFGINNVIKSVTLGKKCESDVDTVKKFLTANGCDAQVNVSKVSLRD